MRLPRLRLMLRSTLRLSNRDMSFLHDMIGKPTPGEVDLRQDLATTRAHAEALEEALQKPDPQEFTDPRRHVEICFERQLAAHVWRKVSMLQSQLNGAENRRYSRGTMCWMLAGFAGVYLQMNGVKIENLGDLVKLLAAVF